MAEPLDSRAESDLRRITASAQPSQTDSGYLAGTRQGAGPKPAARRPRRRIVLVAGAAAVGAAVAVAVPLLPGTPQPAVAATPAMLDDALKPGVSGRARLLALAAVAARDTTIPGDASGKHTARYDSWSLATRVDGDRVEHSIVPESIERSWNADGSGRLVVRHGRGGDTIRDETWQPGGGTLMFDYPIQPTATGLETAFSANRPAKGIRSDTEVVISAIEDLYRETTPPPAVRAAILRLLAGRGDVLALGPVKDRAGRPVQAFALDAADGGLPTRQLLLIEPTTGVLLGSETILTGNPGKLRVRIPAVRSYNLFHPRG